MDNQISALISAPAVKLTVAMAEVFALNFLQIANEKILVTAELAADFACGKRTDYDKLTEELMSARAIIKLALETASKREEWLLEDTLNALADRRKHLEKLDKVIEMLKRQ